MSLVPIPVFAMLTLCAQAHFSSGGTTVQCYTLRRKQRLKFHGSKKKIPLTKSELLLSLP